MYPHVPGVFSDGNYHSAEPTRVSDSDHVAAELNAVVTNKAEHESGSTAGTHR